MPEIGGVRGEQTVPHYGSLVEARKPLPTAAAGPLNKSNEAASRIEKIAAEATVDSSSMVHGRAADGSLSVEQIYSQQQYGLGKTLDLDA